MSLLNNRKLVIGTIAVLASLKFIVVPVIDWQNEQAAVYEKKLRQLNKGLSLLNNREELTAEIESWRAQNVQYIELMAQPAKSATSFQLAKQNDLDKLLEKHGLKAKRSNWLEHIEQGVVEEHKLELSLSGQLKDFISLVIEIEQASPRMAIVDYRMTISKMSPASHKLGNFSGTLVIASWRDLSNIARQSTTQAGQTIAKSKELQSG